MDRRSFVAATAATLAATKVRVTAPDDPLGVRADFPITAQRTYLNSAYIAPVPRAVVQAGSEFLENKSKRPLEVGELLGGDGKLRSQFAQLINASPDEVGLLFSTAEGENIIAQGMDLKAGDNVVIDELHYPTEFVLYRALEASKGIELRIVKHRNGAVDMKDFAALVDDKTRIISVAWISHLNGFRHDLRPIADLAHAHGAVFYADVIQGLGTLALDVQAAGVDAICAGSYKWMLAGFGVAPFYIRKEVLQRLKIDRYGEFQVEKELPDYHFELNQTARKFDYCSRAFGPVKELSAALTYLQGVGIPRIEEHTVGLGQRLYQGLSRQGHRIFTPPGNRSPIVTMFTAKPMTEVRAAFQKAAVDVTVRDGQVRIAPALFNTEAEIDHCLEVTNGLV
ncbi:MAG TPA: aminotransferase class V-fold PLP-dependent enzyme [Gemmatimonadales bacterium]|nr:aminotransferase class V-fold PLP-dependent enzyme [Gemmatimonadales bacterium]